MKIFLFVYLVIGVILTFFGYLSQQINKTYNNKLLFDELKNIQLDIKPPPKWKKELILMLIKLLNIFLYPITIVIFIIDHYRSTRQLINYEKEKSKDGIHPLTYSLMEGNGTIYCRDCGFKKDIVSFLHYEDRGVTYEGNQCQICGDLSSTDSYEKAHLPERRCICGESKFSREEKLSVQNAVAEIWNTKWTILPTLKITI